MPLVQADSDLECAAACLAMVLGHHGREVSVAETHERCGVGRDGATALDLTNAGRSYGLRVQPLSLELDELEDVGCPAILHWGFSHFVVLERFDRRGATIADPASGRRRVERDEIDRKFTGVALSMSPGEGFDRHDEADDEGPAWRLVARRAFRAPRARRIVGQVLLASLGLQLLGLSVPLLTKTVIDTVLPLQIDDVMATLGAGIAVIVLTQLALSFLRGLLLVNLQAKLDAELMTGFFEHLLALPYPYFQERSTGDLLHRLSSNVQIRNVLSNQTLVAVLDGFMVIVYAVVLLATVSLLGLVAVILGAAVALLVLTSRRMTRLVKRELSEQAESEAFLVESVSGIEALKSAGAEPQTLARWTGIFASQLEATMDRSRMSALLGSLTSTLQRFAPLILLWFGAVEVLGGSMSLGTMLALISLSQLFLAPLSSLVAAGLQIQQISGHLERIASVLRTPSEQTGRSVQVAPVLAGDMVFDNVSFRYDESSPWAVRNLSLELSPGMKVALVGRTGSGKSTVAKLALGLYEPTEGRILVDGVPLHDLDLRTVRAQFGVVLQEPTLFNGSIRRNIAYNNPDLSLKSVERAARLAALHEDIEKMPMGYETIIAEGGNALSGGQRQRLAIARALARDPRFLVLDEATSDLDSVTEATVSAHLAEQEVSSLVIAHRLSTVQGADAIIVLEDGETVERGTHVELLDRDGVYAKLVADQMTNTEQRAVR